MRFQQKNTGDDVQAVGDPVLNFLQQHFLLAQQLLGLAQEIRFPTPDFAAIEDICQSGGPHKTHDPFGHKHCHSFLHFNSHFGR